MEKFESKSAFRGAMELVAKFGQFRAVIRGWPVTREDYVKAIAEWDPKAAAVFSEKFEADDRLQAYLREALR